METIASFLAGDEDWNGTEPHPNAEHAPFKLHDHEWNSIRDHVGLHDELRDDFDVLFSWYANDVFELANRLNADWAKEFVKDAAEVRRIILKCSEVALRSLPVASILGDAFGAWLELSRAFCNSEPAAIDIWLTPDCRSDVPTHMHKLVHRLFNILDRRVPGRKDIKLKNSKKRSTPDPARPEFLNIILKIFNDRIRKDARVSEKIDGAVTQNFGTYLLLDQAPEALIRNYVTMRHTIASLNRKPT